MQSSLERAKHNYKNRESAYQEGALEYNSQVTLQNIAMTTKAFNRKKSSHIWQQEAPIDLARREHQMHHLFYEKYDDEKKSKKAEERPTQKVEEVQEQQTQIDLRKRKDSNEENIIDLNKEYDEESEEFMLPSLRKYYQNKQQISQAERELTQLKQRRIDL